MGVNPTRRERSRTFAVTRSHETETVLHLNQTGPQPAADSLGSGRSPEFAQDGPDMKFDGVFRDTQAPGDFPIAQTVSE